MNINKLILFILLLCSIVFAETNSTPKTYIVSPGSRIIYPDGTVFKVTYNMWLLQYNYGIGLRTDAELWINNQPIYEAKIKNRDDLIAKKEMKLINLQLELDSLLNINKYNLGYMKTMHNIFGSPEEAINKNAWKFPLGLAIGLLSGIIISIGTGYVWSQSVGRN